MPRTICKREEVGTAPRGIRWSLWPLTFEQYVTDQEPDTEAAKIGNLARMRFVMWKRLHPGPAPKGWRALSKRPWRVDGFVELAVGEDYKKGWQKQARRDLRLWEEKFSNKTHRIESVSWEEYRAAYAKSTVQKNIGSDAIEALERKHATQIGRQHMALWAVRNLETGTIVAGISPRYSPALKRATYECPFILPEAKQLYAMTALLDHWFRESAKAGMTLLVFNSFWQPGEPKSWKAFSLFKSHFGPSYVAYPPTLWKFVGGKFF